MKMLKLIPIMTMTMATLSVLAFPPRMHSERGTIKAVDPKTRTITLQVCCDTEQLMVQKWTRIRVDGKKLTPHNIAPGTPVRVSYRHEVGGKSLYEVRSIEARTSCADCLACAR